MKLFAASTLTVLSIGATLFATVLHGRAQETPQSTSTGQSTSSGPASGATPQDLPLADAKLITAFQAECLAKARAAAKAYAITIRGKNGWLFFGPELRHVGVGTFWGEAARKTSQANDPEAADPLPAILDFKAQLEKAGIELLMVPVPPKALIYPDMLSSRAVFDVKAPTRFDAAHHQFYELLRSRGVNVLDLTPQFLKQRLDASGALYCKQDTHWSGRGCVLAARLIAQNLQDRAWLQAVPKVKLAQQWKRISIEGDLWQGLGDPLPPRESLPLRFVGRAMSQSTSKAPAVPKPLAPNPSSPVVLLGDSHDLVFHDGDDMHARGAGLPDQLAAELGFAVDLIAVRGSGATPSRTTLMRRVRANPSYLKQKKLVIWCFSAREFTESLGWQKVPIVP